jgi:hypothetical protein
MLEGPPFARELVGFVNKFATTSFESVFRNTKLNTRRVSLPQSTTPPTTPFLNYANAIARDPPQKSNNTNHLAENSGPEAQGPVILRNSKRERVDPQLRYSQQDLMTLKAKKLCNNYHLLGQCAYGSSCVHTHGPKLNPRELDACRFLARQIVCSYGTQCDDAFCFAGHQCQRKSCNISSCRFPGDMHNIDNRVV